LPCASAITAT
jgi:hypothetical protein